MAVKRSKKSLSPSGKELSRLRATSVHVPVYPAKCMRPITCYIMMLIRRPLGQVSISHTIKEIVGRTPNIDLTGGDRLEEPRLEVSDTLSKIHPLLFMAVWARIVVTAVGFYYWRLELASPEIAKTIGTLIGGIRKTTYRSWPVELELFLFLYMLIPYLLLAIVMMFDRRKGMVWLPVTSIVAAVTDIYVIMGTTLSHSLHGIALLNTLINIGVLFSVAEHWKEGSGEVKQENQPWHIANRDFIITIALSSLAPVFVSAGLENNASDKYFAIMPMVFVGFLQACSVSLKRYWRWNLIIMFTAMLARESFGSDLHRIADPHFGLYGFATMIVGNALIYSVFTIPVAIVVFFVRKKINS